MTAGTGWDTGWMRDASCARIPGLPWTDSGTIPPLLIELMAETCAAYPVFAECAKFADEVGVTAGWWAGESRNDREPWDYNPIDRYLHEALALTVDPAVDPDAA